jgi:hypothetical protein
MHFLVFQVGRHGQIQLQWNPLHLPFDRVARTAVRAGPKDSGDAFTSLSSKCRVCPEGSTTVPLEAGFKVPSGWRSKNIMTSVLSANCRLNQSQPVMPGCRGAVLNSWSIQADPCTAWRMPPNGQGARGLQAGKGVIAAGAFGRLAFAAVSAVTVHDRRLVRMSGPGPGQRQRRRPAGDDLAGR